VAEGGAGGGAGGGTSGAGDRTPSDAAPAVFNVLLVGVGGQGIVLASDILAEAALESGLDVKKSEIHGMSQRGGPVFSHVRFGPGPVHSPTIPQGEADVIYALERMELLRWAAWARPDRRGAACYVAQDLMPSGVTAYPDGVEDQIGELFGTVVRFDPRAMRDQVSPKVRNVALLGAVSAWAPLEVAAYAAVLPRLCPPGTAEVNLAAFDLGRRLALDTIGAQAATAAGLAGRGR